jgi:hypothetical protein
VREQSPSVQFSSVIRHRIGITLRSAMWRAPFVTWSGLVRVVRSSRIGPSRSARPWQDRYSIATIPPHSACDSASSHPPTSVYRLRHAAHSCTGRRRAFLALSCVRDRVKNMPDDRGDARMPALADAA